MYPNLPGLTANDSYTYSVLGDSHRPPYSPTTHGHAPGSCRATCGHTPSTQTGSETDRVNVGLRWERCAARGSAGPCVRVQAPTHTSATALVMLLTSVMWCASNGSSRPVTGATRNEALSGHTRSRLAEVRARTTSGFEAPRDHTKRSADGNGFRWRFTSRTFTVLMWCSPLAGRHGHALRRQGEARQVPVSHENQRRVGGW